MGERLGWEVGRPSRGGRQGSPLEGPTSEGWKTLKRRGVEFLQDRAAATLPMQTGPGNELAKFACFGRAWRTSKEFVLSVSVCSTERQTALKLDWVTLLETDPPPANSPLLQSHLFTKPILDITTTCEPSMLFLSLFCILEALMGRTSCQSFSFLALTV